jgi:hypothetical protein
VIPDLLIVALDYFREPRRFPQLSNPLLQLPAGVTELLAAWSDDLSDAQIGETAKLLNATEDQCREALLFFVKQTLLEAGGDHYRTLGLPRAAGSALIKQHYHYLIRLFHPDREATGNHWDDVYAARINEAYAVLRDPRKRLEYDETLPEEDGFGPQLVGGGFPLAPALSPGHTASPRVVPPAAGKAALLLFGAVTCIIAILLLGQTRQPGLRVQPTTGHEEVSRPLVSQSEPGMRNDLSWVSGQLELSAEDGTIANAPVILPDAESHDADASPRETSQSIEDIVRERVAEATFAVLGPPRESTSPPPEPPGKAVASRVGARTLTAQVTPAYDTLAIRGESMPVITNEFEQPPASTSQALPEPKSDPGNAGLGGLSASAIPASVIDRPGEGAASPVPLPGGQPEGLDSPAPMPGGVAESKSSLRDDAQLNVALAELLRALTQSYDTGDAEAFASLFSIDAHTTDASGKDAILRLYAQFFALPERREITIRQFVWGPENTGVYTGNGLAYIVTRPFNGGKAAHGELLLRLQVKQQLDGFKITEMEYRYQ